MKIIIIISLKNIGKIFGNMLILARQILNIWATNLLGPYV